MKIGTGELLLILVVALFVLGPEKMPFYAKKVGETLNTLKGYTAKLTEEINENIMAPLEEVKQPLKEATDPLKNIAKEITQPMEQMRYSIDDIEKPSQNKIQDKTEELGSDEIAQKSTSNI